MANFTESIAAILRAIDGLGLLPLQRRSRDARPGTFLAVASAFLSRTVDDRVVTNVLEALEGVGWAGASVLAKVDQGEIEALFESSGIRGLTKSIKPLLKLAQWFTDEIGDEAEGTHATESLRDGLRSISGIGPATSDALLRDGFARASYPVDRATYRILVRHGWIDDNAEYDEVRALIEGPLQNEPARLIDLGAGFEAIGRQWCKAGVPRCEKCPLRGFLPEGGPCGDS